MTGRPLLVVTLGLPGSGKSTRARRWVAAAPDRRCRVNRDDTRAMMHGGRLGTDVQEQQVTVATHAAILALLRAGWDVVCDDTNLDPARLPSLLEVAEQAGATVEIWDLRDVPVEECLRRNRLRHGSARVPDVVITGMYADYIEGREVTTEGATA